MTWLRDPRVDDYLRRMPDGQRDHAERVRRIVHAVDPEMTETIKRTVQPYFVLQGNVCALLTTKDHLDVFLYDGGTVADPAGIITHGWTNSTARQISLHEGDSLNGPALHAIFAEIVANNRAGGWRAVKQRRGL